MRTKCILFILFFIGGCTAIGEESSCEELKEKSKEIDMSQDGEKVTFLARVNKKEESISKYGSETIVEVTGGNKRDYIFSFLSGQLIRGMVSILNQKEIIECLKEKYNCDCKEEIWHAPQINVCSCNGFRVYDGGSLTHNIPPLEEGKVYEITLEKKQAPACKAVITGIGIEGERSEEVRMYAGKFEEKVLDARQEYVYFHFSSIDIKERNCNI